MTAENRGDSVGHKTLTKRDLVVRIAEESQKDQDKENRLTQQQVLMVVQKTLDYISEALAHGDKVELRNFGVFEVKVRKARVGRNPNAPETDVPIPERSVVKFKAGKEMRTDVLKLPLEKEVKPAAQKKQGALGSGPAPTPVPGTTTTPGSRPSATV